MDESDRGALSRDAFAEALARQGLRVPAERFETVFDAACAIERAVGLLRRRSRALPSAPAGLPCLDDRP